MEPLRRIGITGATGAIGLALIDICIEQGTEVYAFTHSASKRTGRIPEHPLVHKVDLPLDKMADFDETLPELDVLYHLAWMKAFGAEDRNDLHAQIRNIEYSIDAVRLAGRLSCRVFIGAGSQAEYGRVRVPLRDDTPCHPENGYGMAKLAAGQMTRLECERLGIGHIWTRILSVYGPGDGEGTLVMSVIRDALKGTHPQCTKGEQIWDYLYSKDAGRLLYLLGERGISGRTYVVGSGRAKPLKDYIEAICDACAEIVPEIGRVTPVYGGRPYAADQVMHLESDITGLTEDTGYRPDTAFEEGIRETVRWTRDQI